MSLRYKSSESILPHFELNHELIQLFEKDELVRPKNYCKLKVETKTAFDVLCSYKDQEYALTPSSYKNVLKLLTELEDVMSQSKISDIRLENKRLQYVGDFLSESRSYKLYMNVAKELPPEIGDGDFVFLRTMRKANYYSNTDYTELSITKVDKRFLEIETSENCHEILENTLYEVKFEKDRTVFRFEQLAIRDLQPNVIPKVIFPKVCGEAADLSMKFDWFSKTIKTNPEQQQAVRNIVNGSSFPAPYILFGPPGTGKTTTLVEAIAQVWKIHSNANILVCASSNYACNEILTRLMDLHCVPETKMFRYFSKSQLRKVNTIDERILEVSNIKKKKKPKIEYPTAEKLQTYRIIFLTLVAAGRLTLLGKGTHHFDYIFVDEAGSATEASTIIPIAGLMSFVGSKRSHVIFAGDPKQLGPVVMHRPAENFMYGRSMLERLMELDLYLPDPVTKQYNPACLTKLLQNFRSHKNILDTPNELFYDNQLLAMAKPNITNVALGQPFLPNKKIPIVFHAVFGKTKGNPSMYNLQECAVVLDYVRKVLKVKFHGETVLPKDIGIITPYRRQCEELTKLLKDRMKLTDIEVGSVEQFQGQERKVIILSTVRSFTNSIGFLNNPKRLNVSITRAKALLIIVGNPRTLQLDKNWSKVIKYCVEHNVCTGKKFKLKKSVKVKRKLISKPPNPLPNPLANVTKSTPSASQPEIESNDESTSADLISDKEDTEDTNSEPPDVQDLMIFTDDDWLELQKRLVLTDD